jgi:hypothetical protein
MSRHDIRIRRQSFATGNIQKHKNYRELMRKHRRHNRGRNFYLLALIVALALIGYGVMMVVG